MWSKPQGATVALVEGLSPQLPAKATRGFQRGLGVAKEERCADVPCAAFSDTLMSVAGFHSSREESMHEFINEFFSQCMNVYTRQSWISREAEVLTSQQNKSRAGELKNQPMSNLLGLFPSSANIGIKLSNLELSEGK